MFEMKICAICISHLADIRHPSFIAIPSVFLERLYARCEQSVMNFSFFQQKEVSSQSKIFLDFIGGQIERFWRILSLSDRRMLATKIL